QCVHARPHSTPFPYTTLFRSRELVRDPLAKLFGGPIAERHREDLVGRDSLFDQPAKPLRGGEGLASARPRGDQECAEWTCVRRRDRKSTRLNSSHQIISYAVF